MQRSFLLCCVMVAIGWTVQAKELHHSKLSTHTGPYCEPTIIMTMGETVSHSSSTLKGDVGYGIGFDVGYSFTENFAFEVDGTYSKANVKETRSTGETQTSSASFYTYGVNAVMTYPLHHHFIILGKVGYDYEHEDLGSLDIKGSDRGANWTAGFEYSFNPHIEVSFEYEGSEVKKCTW